MDAATLELKLEELRAQRDKAQATLLRLQGAVAILEHLLENADEVPSDEALHVVHSNSRKG